MKKPKTFRLSEQAQNHLADVVKMTGTNETAIVEMALAFFVQKMRDDFINSIGDEKKVISSKDKKPRKRKRS